MSFLLAIGLLVLVWLAVVAVARAISEPVVTPDDPRETGRGDAS